MIIKKILALLIIIISSQGIFGREFSVKTLDSLIENYSISEILAGNFDEAEKKIRSIEYNDSGLFYLALGEIDLRRQNREKAIMNFIVSAEVSEKVAPFAFRKLGDIELFDGNLAYAVSAYRIAAQKTNFENYRYYLYTKIDSLKNVFPDSLGSVIWAIVFGESEYSRDGEYEENPSEVIEQALAEENALTADLFDSLYSFSKEKKIEKRFLSRISDTTVADSTINAKTAFEIANEMFAQNIFDGASSWLHFAINRKNFNAEVSQRRYLNFRTQLNYSMKNWGNVIKFGKEYMAKHGETSDLLYKVGRSYRQSGNLAEAHKYYEKHVKAYPNNKITHDILWYMAWVREENRNYESAKDLFRKLAEQKPVGKNGEESGFRVGLLDFRQKKYDAAINEFAKFRAKFPNSSFVSASLYWTARAYSAKNDSISAKKTIEILNKKYPLTYYDFRARQIFGDTTVEILKISDSLWHSRIDAAPKTETKGNSSSENLDNLLLGIFLGNLGLTNETELLFEPLENQNIKNYPMTLSLSRFYLNVGAYYRSYRLARRLYWALPSNERGEFSPEYLELFYPIKSFAEEINASSEKFGVEPALVRGVMRQESMFSPTILSPVGAMGLMQVMPATGKEIAAELKVPFEQSKLLTPSSNVEFGTFYLGKRLRQFDGNFVSAIASYNGGAHNVKKWIEMNKDVLDDEPYFVECIGFSETRKYVKLVLENYWIYKRMLF